MAGWECMGFEIPLGAPVKGAHGPLRKYMNNGAPISTLLTSRGA